jgi:hypothetical protein
MVRYSVPLVDLYFERELMPLFISGHYLTLMILISNSCDFFFTNYKLHTSRKLIESTYSTCHKKFSGYILPMSPVVYNYLSGIDNRTMPYFF